MKYSSDKGDKTFFHKRKVNIEKVNEQLGFFGGGSIVEPPESREVVLEMTGGENPFEEGAMHHERSKSAATMNDKDAHSPKKPPLNP